MCRYASVPGRHRRPGKAVAWFLLARQQLVHAVAALVISVVVTRLCYVFMRSWESAAYSSSAERLGLTRRCFYEREVPAQSANHGKTGQRRSWS